MKRNRGKYIVHVCIGNKAEDKYNYRNSEDYEGRKELRKKESRDRKIERRSIKETGHVDEFSARKSYNKKNNSD